MTVLPVLLTNLCVIAGLMFVVWLISLPLKDVSIVDLVWGMGFVIVAWVTFGITDGSGPTHWLLPVMTTIWGVRLSLYLAWRNIGNGEDKRYVEMREKRGSRFAISSLWVVFGLQGAVMWVVSWPLQVGITLAEPGWTWLHAVGVSFWLIGLLFESIGDLQLAKFKSNPQNAGKVMDQGLWHYTRHPNYFGDFMIWWGFFATAISHGKGIWTIISPIVMAVFLLRISGVTLLEKSLVKTRTGFAEYAERTNAFWPWFPATKKEEPGNQPSTT